MPPPVGYFIRNTLLHRSVRDKRYLLFPQEVHLHCHGRKWSEKSNRIIQKLYQQFSGYIYIYIPTQQVLTKTVITHQKKLHIICRQVYNHLLLHQFHQSCCGTHRTKVALEGRVFPIKWPPLLLLLMLYMQLIFDQETDGKTGCTRPLHFHT